MIYFSDFGVPAPAGGDLRTVVGNSQWNTASAGATSLAQLVKITAPSGVDSLLQSVKVCVSSMGAGVGLKALLVADNAGVPSSTLIALGTAVVPGAITDTVVDCAFASPQTLTAGTSYWIGYVPSASIAVAICDNAYSNTQCYSVALSYTATSWDAGADVLDIRAATYAVLERAGTATGLHHQGSSGFFQSAGIMRIAFPDHAIGDTIRLNFLQSFGTLTATPSGWTKTYEDVIAGFGGFLHVIYTRVIDGTEGGTAFISSPSGHGRMAVATVFRGGGTVEGKVVATSSGTSATSAAVTTSGANRRVYNFLVGAEAAGGQSNPDTSDTWTDVYTFGSLAGNDYIISLSYKDIAVAGSSGTETRTVSNTFWHYTSFAIPDA